MALCGGEKALIADKAVPGTSSTLGDCAAGGCMPGMRDRALGAEALGGTMGGTVGVAGAAIASTAAGAICTTVEDGE